MVNNTYWQVIDKLSLPPSELAKCHASPMPQHCAVARQLVEARPAANPRLGLCLASALNAEGEPWLAPSRR